MLDAWTVNGEPTSVGFPVSFIVGLESADSLWRGFDGRSRPVALPHSRDGRSDLAGNLTSAFIPSTGATLPIRAMCRDAPLNLQPNIPASVTLPSWNLYHCHVRIVHSIRVRCTQRYSFGE